MQIRHILAVLNHTIGTKHYHNCRKTISKEAVLHISRQGTVADILGT